MNSFFFFGKVNGPSSPTVSEQNGDSFAVQGLVIHGNQNLTDKESDEHRHQGLHRPKVVCLSVCLSVYLSFFLSFFFAVVVFLLALNLSSQVLNSSPQYETKKKKKRKRKLFWWMVRVKGRLRSPLSVLEGRIEAVVHLMHRYFRRDRLLTSGPWSTTPHVWIWKMAPIRLWVSEKSNYVLSLMMLRLEEMLRKLCVASFEQIPNDGVERSITCFVMLFPSRIILWTLIAGSSAEATGRLRWVQQWMAWTCASHQQGEWELGKSDLVSVLLQCWRQERNNYVTVWTVSWIVHLQEIYSHNPNVKWDDIIGLENAKRLVKEAVVYPIKVRTQRICRSWWFVCDAQMTNSSGKIQCIHVMSLFAVSSVVHWYLVPMERTSTLWSSRYGTYFEIMLLPFFVLWTPFRNTGDK